jgi:hypothetical protein
MEEADKAAYDERDLAGLKVRHGAEQFEEGEDVILTLRDSRVLEGEGVSCLVLWVEELVDGDADAMTEDELQNVNMVDEEAIKAAKERKRKAQEQYTGYDDEEFEEGRIGQKADILGKYDDEFSTGKVKSEVSVMAVIVVGESVLIVAGVPTWRANREENDHHRRGHGDDRSSPSNQGEAEPGLCKYVELSIVLSGEYADCCCRRLRDVGLPQRGGCRIQEAEEEEGQAIGEKGGGRRGRCEWDGGGWAARVCSTGGCEWSGKPGGRR